MGMVVQLLRSWGAIGFTYGYGGSTASQLGRLVVVWLEAEAAPPCTLVAPLHGGGVAARPIGFTYGYGSSTASQLRRLVATAKRLN